jgi:ATP phosphoribosyltransferase
MSQKIRLAIQKSGRLSDDSLNLIKESGIRFVKTNGALRAESSNFDLEFLFLRVSDIPGYVEDGLADLGIIGDNVHVEKNKNVDVIMPLGFSKCRLSIGVPKSFEYNSIKDLDGKKIATSYPKILGNFLKENNINASIEEISGSVEIAPSIGLAEGICDIVSTGSTLISNGLKEVETIFKSEAILIGHKNLNAEKVEILNKLKFRINAVLAAKNKKYITLNCPTEATQRIIEILPGVKSPSITTLAEKGWNSISSVVDENEFWDVINKLQDAGAEGILVLPIEKIIR